MIQVLDGCRLTNSDKEGAGEGTECILRMPLLSKVNLIFWERTEEYLK